MGKETAFWEAAVAVAPLLALTLIVEFWAMKVHRLRPGVRLPVALYLIMSIALLCTATIFSMLKLMFWGQATLGEGPATLRWF